MRQLKQGGSGSGTVYAQTFLDNGVEVRQFLEYGDVGDGLLVVHDPIELRM